MSTNTLCLERLPDFAIERIFDILCTADLLKLSAISRNLHEFANNCLYKKILMSADPSVLHKSWAEEMSQTLKFTVMDDQNITKLLESLDNNEALVGLVESISVVRSDSVEEEDILPLVETKALYTDKWIFVSPETVKNLTVLSCPLSLAVGLTRNLVDLRIIFQDESISSDFFQSLARDLTFSGGAETLRKLVFTVEGKIHHYLLEDSPLYQFMCVLGHHTSILKLNTLGLPGPITWFIFYAVENLLDLSYLKSLEVQSHDCSGECCNGLGPMLKGCTSLENYG